MMMSYVSKKTLVSALILTAKVVGIWVFWSLYWSLFLLIVTCPDEHTFYDAMAYGCEDDKNFDPMHYIGKTVQEKGYIEMMNYYIFRTGILETSPYCVNGYNTFRFFGLLDIWYLHGINKCVVKRRRFGCVDDLFGWFASQSKRRMEFLGRQRREYNNDNDDLL